MFSISCPYIFLHIFQFCAQKQWLVNDIKVDINAQNAKGNTGLHMSVGYDFWDQTYVFIFTLYKKIIQRKFSFTQVQTKMLVSIRFDTFF